MLVPWDKILHSVLERIWIKCSYVSQWLPQGERGPSKESKSRWIKILHGGSRFTLWFLKIKIFRITPKLFFALQYIKNWTKVVPWNFFFVPEKKLLVQKKLWNFFLLLGPTVEDFNSSWFWLLRGPL